MRISLQTMNEGPFNRICRRDYKSAQVLNYFSNKFPRTFHSLCTEKDCFRYTTQLAVKFKNGHTVVIGDIEAYEDKDVLARCIMVHDLTDPIP